MPIRRDMAVVFRVAAGPRLGFGHLARCRAIADALGVRPRMSVRGSAATRMAARRLDVALVDGRHVWTAPRPDVLVVDDPHAASARRAVAAARRRGVPVVAIADSGQGRLAADLVVDGRANAPAPRGPMLRGPRFAIVDARIARLRHRPAARRARLVVALGGGRHVRQHVALLVAALAAALPRFDIRVAPGFTSGPRPVLPAGQWLAPGALAPTLATASLAVVGGGVTAYEALALGVPSLGVAVVDAQRPTLRQLARLGVMVNGGAVWTPHAAGRVAGLAARLAAAPALGRRLAARGRRLVDGKGTHRIAAAIAALAEEARHG